MMFLITLLGAFQMQTVIQADKYYQTNNIIHGRGEVVAVMSDNGMGWMLPGEGITHDREKAEQYAIRLDHLISTNMPKYNRRLFH